MFNSITNDSVYLDLDLNVLVNSCLAYKLLSKNYLRLISKLFEGLYIHDKWNRFKKYPVIHLDFTELAYDTPGRLKNSLSLL
ncbi:MAG: AAA family ATPase [Endomicrobium sp.]|nr:AAA family ATPase [Endomicrobium sp.]